MLELFTIYDEIEFLNGIKYFSDGQTLIIFPPIETWDVEFLSGHILELNVFQTYKSYFRKAKIKEWKSVKRMIIDKAYKAVLGENAPRARTHKACLTPHFLFYFILFMNAF